MAPTVCGGAAAGKRKTPGERRPLADCSARLAACTQKVSRAGKLAGDLRFPEIPAPRAMIPQPNALSRRTLGDGRYALLNRRARE